MLILNYLFAILLVADGAKKENMDKTIIAWTDHTFNPWMGCVKVSDGCKNCYAEDLTKNRMGLALWGSNGTRQVTSPGNWKKPIVWNNAARAAGRTERVFCASLCDVFEDHPTANAARPRLWNLIRDTPNLEWQLLTKRPENIARFLPPRSWGVGGWPNVWLGTSIEDNRVAHRAAELVKIPAVVHFVSYEPALGPLDDLDLTHIDWVIYGGESGARHRDEDKQWARAMRDRCSRSGVAFFHKQSAHRFTERGIELDGEIIRQYPSPAARLLGNAPSIDVPLPLIAR